MIKETPEYIEKYGRTNDIVLGIVMFWMVTSINKDRHNLEYFNEKMDRYLDYQSTEEQMNRYKKEMIYSILDDNNSFDTITNVIDIIIDIYKIENLDYQVHMYGPSEDNSGDWWLGNREIVMGEMDKDGGVFSIISSSNGISLDLSHRMTFLSSEDWSRLYRNYNINKILR